MGVRKERSFDDILELVNNENCYQYFTSYVTNSVAEKSRIYPLLNQIESIIQEGEFDFSSKKEELGEILKRLQSSKKARNNPIRWFFWKMFSKDRYIIKRALVANALELNRKSIKLLEYKMDSRLNLEHNISVLKSLNWVVGVLDAREPSKLMNWVTDQKCAMDAKELYDTLRSFKEFFQFKNTTLDDFVIKVKKLFEILNDVKTKELEWKKYVSETQIKRIPEEDGYVEK